MQRAKRNNVLFVTVQLYEHRRLKVESVFPTSLVISLRSEVGLFLTKIWQVEIDIC